MTRLAHLVAALRTGFLRAAGMPSIPVDSSTNYGLAWLNEATLVGISVPAPRSVR